LRIGKASVKAERKSQMQTIMTIIPAIVFLVVPFILIWLGVKNIKAKKQARGIIAIVLGALLLVPVIVIIMVMAFRVAIVVG
jgi:hypothetical protein